MNTILQDLNSLVNPDRLPSENIILLEAIKTIETLFLQLDQFMFYANDMCVVIDNEIGETSLTREYKSNLIENNEEGFLCQNTLQL